MSDRLVRQSDTRNQEPSRLDRKGNHQRSLIMAADHMPRRIRFYKPPGEEIPTGKQDPSSTIPRAKSLAQRFAEATPTVALPKRTAEIISSESTPVSRTTPETLRTLELNWRERRRAKLEDITLQRAMGVEAREPEARRKEPMNPKASGKVNGPFKETRQTRTPPSESTRPAIVVPEEEPVCLSGPASTTRQSSPLQSIPVNRTSIASQARPSLAFTANNTTYQTRTNRARKIVKLVRDARHSVQANSAQATSDSLRCGTQDSVELPKDSLAAGEKLQRTTEASSKRSMPPQAASQEPLSRHPSGPTTSAIPLRLSEILSGPKPPPNECSRNSPQQFSRSSYLEYPLARTAMDILQPIIASPLPSREYHLTATSSLIIYPYGEDWSINLEPQDPVSSPTKRRRRRHPMMSAVTTSERMDILDEGQTMRIKPSRSNATGSRQSRYLELQHAARWDPSDRRRWQILSDLVQRLKAKTRKVSIPISVFILIC